MEKILQSIGITFGVIGLLLCVVGMGVRLFKIKQQGLKRSEILICLAVGAMGWHVFIYLLIYTGLIRELPNLYNKGIPFYYLIGPSMYFATLFALFPQQNTPKFWWVHLLPFILGLIDIFPYALASSVEKKNLLEQIVQDIKLGVTHHYGFIDQKWHYIIRFFLAFVYLMAQWRLLYIYDERFSSIRGGGRAYMLLFSTLYSLYLLMQSGMVLSLLFNQTQSSFIMRDVGQLIWISLFYFIFSLWMFISAIYQPASHLVFKKVEI
ncbi:hypothetical protein [Sphingobacterium sp. LRF_L2]|uniref:hypothetical protein n=1 Tax=Sphingobacterium sp. LRF_L2 TaxID=3369421 RepID=UPI003F5FF86F